MNIKIIIFALATIEFIIYSWPLLLNPRSYVFFRFFAFEAILTLFLINAGFLLTALTSPAGIASLVLLAGAIIFTANGFYLIRVIGRAKVLAEDTDTLVTAGIYNYIRHPLYGSLIFLSWAGFLKHITQTTTLLVLAITILLAITAGLEEKENIKKFGQSYEEYLGKTKMFVPFLV